MLWWALLAALTSGRLAQECVAGTGVSCGQVLLQTGNHLTKTVANDALADTASRWVHEPRSLHWDDLKASALKPDPNTMKKMDLIVPGGAKVQVFGYPDDYVSDVVSSAKTWEPNLVSEICRLWNTDTTAKAEATGNFLDVGGNIGTFTLPVAACIAGRGKVFTVEAMPITAANLKAGIVENGLQNVAVFPYAVGSELPENKVEMALNPTNRGGSYVNTGEHSGSNAEDMDKFSISLTTLDAMLIQEPGIQRLRAMKIDIEGFEGRALQGAKELLAKFPPCMLIIELCPDWLKQNGTPLKDVVSDLAEAGYDTSKIKKGEFWQETYTLHQKDMQRCLARL